MKKEKIYNKIIRIIREMYEIQTPVIKDVKEILIKKGYTVNLSLIHIFLLPITMLILPASIQNLIITNIIGFDKMKMELVQSMEESV